MHNMLNGTAWQRAWRRNLQVRGRAWSGASGQRRGNCMFGEGIVMSRRADEMIAKTAFGMSDGMDSFGQA